MLCVTISNKLRKFLYKQWGWYKECRVVLYTIDMRNMCIRHLVANGGGVRASKPPPKF